MDKRIAAIVVSYNNYNDTIECLASLAYSSDAELSHIFLVDNSPTDESVSFVQSWITKTNKERTAVSNHGKGIAPACCTELNRMATHPEFSICKFVADSQKTTSRRRFSSFLISEGDPLPLKNNEETITLIIIKSKYNRGYAGGINLGLAYALKLDIAFFWVLNNDTIVHPEACLELKNALQSSDRPGIAGGLVLYHDQPAMVQCLAGGYTSPVFFLSNLIGHALPLEKVLTISSEFVEKTINFIYGASFMMSRPLIEQVGTLNESLFLYCEEQDLAWSIRGKFDLAYAPKAIIIHKEGRSTKLTKYERPFSRLALIARNKILVTLRHRPWALPTVLIGICFSIVRNSLRSSSAQ